MAHYGDERREREQQQHNGDERREREQQQYNGGQRHNKDEQHKGDERTTTKWWHKKDFHKLVVTSGASHKYFEHIAKHFGSPAELHLLPNPWPQDKDKTKSGDEREKDKTMIGDVRYKDGKRDSSEDWNYIPRPATASLQEAPAGDSLAAGSPAAPAGDSQAAVALEHGNMESMAGGSAISAVAPSHSLVGLTNVAAA